MNRQMQKIVDGLREKSENKENPLSEWRILRLEEDGLARCICGKKINHIHLLQNKLSYETVAIGKNCLEKLILSF